MKIMLQMKKINNKMHPLTLIFFVFTLWKTLNLSGVLKL